MKTMKLTIAALAITALAFNAAADVTSTNYGDFAAANVDFLQVSEHTTTFGDEVPKYGAPIVSSGSDTMDFIPHGFSAEAGNGDLDYTDGNLSFIVQGRDEAVIEQISFYESGFYSLLGNNGTDATHVNVTAAFDLWVHEINGVPVTPFKDSFWLAMSPGDGTYEMVTDGPGTQIAWEGFVVADVNLMVANHNDYGVNDYATKVSVNLNNELSAFSEEGTIASIAKKSFQGGVSIEIIPEPASVLLLAGASAAIAFVRRRFIG